MGHLLLASIPLMGLLLVLGLLFSLVKGVAVLRQGAWPARQGSEPHCHHCDYNLTGLEPGICPECGKAWTAETIVRGQRHRRPLAIVRGALVSAISLGVIGTLIGRALPRIDYYQFLPASAILQRVSSSTPATAQRAIDEFQRRIPLGSVSSKQIDEFLGKVVTFSLRVRPTIIKGDPVIFEAGMITASLKCIGFQVVETRYQADDGPIVLGYCPDYYCPGAPGPRQNGFTTCVDTPEPGKHKMRLWYRVRYFYDSGNSGTNPPASSPLADRETLLEAPFEVLPSEPPGYIKLIRDPGLQQAMHNSIRVMLLKLEPGQSINGKRSVQGDLESRIRNCPAPAAFDVLVRIDGKEYPFTSVTFAKGLTISYCGTACGYDGPLADTVDIILRTSSRAARQTFDMFEIWDGELVYSNVPVQIDAAVRAAASQATN